MTIDEAIYHLQELADSKFEQMRRYDRASGYAISHNEDIRTADAKRLEQRAKECIQIAKWLKELKSFKEKEEPRAVRYEGDGYAEGEMVVDYAYCPNCDHETEVDSENWGSMFCPECGQRLRWEND